MDIEKSNGCLNELQKCRAELEQKKELCRKAIKQICSQVKDGLIVFSNLRPGKGAGLEDSLEAEGYVVYYKDAAMTQCCASGYLYGIDYYPENERVALSVNEIDPQSGRIDRMKDVATVELEDVENVETVLKFAVQFAAQQENRPVA